MNTILFLQSSANPALTAFFHALTFFGDEMFYLLLFPALYWTWRKGPMRRLVVLFLPSLMLTLMLKELVAIPRPAGVALISADGYSFPSGHALGATLVWGYLALEVHRRAFRIGAVLLVALISLSRVYLGVHWPADVAGGVAIGALLLVAFRSIERPASAAFRRMHSAECALILLAACIAAVAVLPQRGMMIISGLFGGMGIGMIVEDRWIHFLPGGCPKAKVGRILLGTAGTLSLWAGLKHALPETPVFLMLRYALTGGWMMGLAPVLFLRLGWMSRQADGAPVQSAEFSTASG